MFGLFSSVNQKLLAQATVGLSGEFYLRIKDQISFSSDNVIIVQSEFPIFALSVVNAFVAMRQKNPNKILAQNTQASLAVFGQHFEAMTKGSVSAGSYAAGILKKLSDEVPEYSAIVASAPPERQPEMLVRCFAKRAKLQFNSDSAFQDTCEAIAELLSTLIDNLKKAGV